MDETRLGKYEIRSTLGRGAMGTVYEGWDPVISRKVAIKTVRLPDSADVDAQEELARFKREAQAAGRLNHPNIVGVFDYGETADLAYIVMEFIDGASLKGVLDKQERFAPPEILRVMEGLLAGLQFSHERGVVHRDIKPANIMLTAERQVKIADFGIARIESSSMTQAGTVLGTPAYMSPEQFMGQTVDARSDIYSAGVLLYQLLTGERPFEGSMSSIMHKALNTEVPRPSELSVTAPPALDAVVARAMAKRPEQRYATAQDFARALREAVTAPQAEADADATLVRTPATARLAPPAPAAPPARSRGSLLPVLAGALLLVMIAAGGAWYYLQPRTAPEQVAAIAPATIPEPPPAAPPTPPAPNPVAPTPPAPITQAPITEAPVTQVPVTQAPVTPAPPLATLQPAPTPTPTPQPLVQPPAPPTATQAQPTPVPASPTQAAPPAPAAPLRPAPSPASLAAALRPVGCTLAHAQFTDATRLLVDGLAGAGAPEAELRRVVAEAAPSATSSFRLRSFNGPYCGALDALRPIAPADLRPGAALGMALKGNVARLRKGDKILLQFTMPDFPAHLQLDYLASDGSMTHLVADDGASVRVMTGDGWKIVGPSRAHPPGALVTIGEPDPKSGDGSWSVDEPFGTDMILAIVSSRPLFAAPRPADDSVAAYLRDLPAAFAAAQTNGGHITAQALPLETALR